MFDKGTQNILDIALRLIEGGKSTPETAFMDALNIDRTHCNGMITHIASTGYCGNSSCEDANFYDARKQVKLSTPLRIMPYELAYKAMAKAAYNRLSTRDK